MRVATKVDRHLLIDILSLAFVNNPSTLFVVRRGRGEQRRIRRLIRYSVRVGLRAGGCYLTDDDLGAAILFEGRNKPATVLDQALLIIGAMGLRRIRPVLEKEAYVAARHPETPFIDLWYLGVSPPAQGCGTGSGLLRDIIDMSEKKQLPIYLETSSDRAVSFYLRHGFEVYDETTFEFPFRCLRRTPRGNAAKTVDGGSTPLV